MRKRVFWGKAMAGLLAAAMTMQGTAGLAAEPKRGQMENFAAQELADILTAFREAKTSPSLLEETLGLEQLMEAMKQEGVQVKLSLAPSDGTLRALGYNDEVPQDISGELCWQHDPVRKTWSLQLGGKVDGEYVLNGQLWGDTEKLLLSIPQFFQGAVGVRSGNLSEQYQGSALETLIGEEELELPDVDLYFYPGCQDGSEGSKPAGKFERKLEEKAEELKNLTQVEKEELSGEEAVYHVSYATEDILDLYGYLIQEYLVALTDYGTVERRDAMEFLNEVTKALSSVRELLDDEFTVDFYTEENCLKKIYTGIYMDTTGYQEDPYRYEGKNDEFDLSLEVEEDFDGYVEYQIVFDDPKHPMDTFDLMVEVCDMTGREQKTNLWMTKQTKTIGSTSEFTLTLMVKENNQIVYWDVPLMASFDTQTGDLDASLSLGTEDDLVSLQLDSSFKQIKPGLGFVWELDGLTLTAEGERVGLTGQLAVTAQAGDSARPEDTTMIFEAAQGELYLLLNEIMINSETWAAQFESEPENWTEAESEDWAEAAPESWAEAAPEDRMEAESEACEGTGR